MFPRYYMHGDVFSILTYDPVRKGFQYTGQELKTVKA